MELYCSFNRPVGPIYEKITVIASDHFLLQEVRNLTMKKLHLMIITLGIVSISMLWVASPGNCQQVWPMPPMRAPMEGLAACPPPVCGPPMPCAPPSYGPQQYCNNNWACGPNLSCFSNGCGQAKPRISVDAQVGYGYLGLNFGMRPPYGADLELSFNDANLAIGSVEARAESCRGFFLALRGQGSATRNIGVDTSQELLDARHWDGSELKWWTLEGYTGFRIMPCWSALVGLRREEVSVGLTKPKNAAGQALAPPIIPVPGVVEVSPLTKSGSFSSKQWLPYIGLEFTGQRYRASFLWSPFTSANIAASDKHSFTFTNLLPPFLSHQEIVDLEYRVQKPGDFIEYNFEYSLDVSPRLAFQLWSRGNSMWIRGRGNFNMLVTARDSEGGVLTFSGTAFDASDNDTATFTRWMITAGIGTALFF